MIPIKKVKEIREELNLTHLVIFGKDEEGISHVCTHGKTRLDAKRAAEAGNTLKRIMNWPADLCEAKPLERICKNCEFWKMDKTDPGSRIPERWLGKCHYEPSLITRYEEDTACCHFEPNR